jgi:hypothetical protein
MYKCDICSKVCSSQRKYLSHVETCRVNNQTSMVNLYRRSDSASSMQNYMDNIDNIDNMDTQSTTSSTSIFSSANKPLLKSTIDKLMKDRSRYKDELKKVIKEKEELSRRSIQDKQYSLDRSNIEMLDSVDSYRQENLRLSQKLDKERDDTRKHLLKLQNDKEFIAVMLKQEKEQALISLSAEKENIIQSLQFTINKLTNEKENANKEYEIVIQERNNTIDRLKHIYMQTSEKAIKDNKDIIDHVQHQSIQTEQMIKEKYEKEKQILLMAHLDAINKINLDNTYMIDSISKKHKEELHNRDKTISELEEINHKIGAQVSNYLSTIENMTADISRMKQQFITTLNTQQEDHDKVLRERNSFISKLELDIKNASDKVKNELYKENIDIKDKINKLTTQFTTELNKQRKELLDEKDKLKISRDSDREDFIKQMNTLQSSSDKKQQEMNNIIEGLNKQMNAVQSSTNKKEKEMSTLQSDIDKKEQEMNSVVESLKKQLQDKSDQLEKLKVFASENMLKMKHELQIMSHKTKSTI